MESLNLNKKILRKFAVKISFILFLWGTFLLWRQKEIYPYFYSIGIVLLLVGIVSPILINPLYIIIMKLAYGISWFITHLILIFVFYLIITPYGFIMRLFGLNPLEIKIDRKKKSYWKVVKKKQNDKADFERLF